MAVLGLCSASSSSLRGTWAPLEINHSKARSCRVCLKRNAVIRAEVNFVNADEAKRLVAEEGYTILDVRDKTQFKRAHIKSCCHVPLFVENDDNDLGTIFKRTVHNNFSGLFFGLPFTKPNPDFVQSVKNQFSTDSKLLVVCQEGLRSAAAAYKLDKQGFQNISCITSGLQSTKPGTFDSIGSVELQNAGKAGLVTIQGKISAVLGTVLISVQCKKLEGQESPAQLSEAQESPAQLPEAQESPAQRPTAAPVACRDMASRGEACARAFLFITFFPDQAEKLFQLFPAS